MINVVIGINSINIINDNSGENINNGENIIEDIDKATGIHEVKKTNVSKQV